MMYYFKICLYFKKCILSPTLKRIQHLDKRCNRTTTVEECLWRELCHHKYFSAL